MRRRRTVSKRYYKRKLAKLFGSSRLRDLAILVWSADAVRDGEPERAKKYLTFPKEVVGAKLGEKHFFTPWTLETLFNEALTHPPAPAGASKLLNTGRWETFASLYNLGRVDIQDSQSGWFVIQTGYWVGGQHDWKDRNSMIAFGH